jgi:hypothetical protein
VSEVVRVGDYEMTFVQRGDEVAFALTEVAGNMTRETMIEHFRNYLTDVGKWESTIKLARDFAVDSGLVKDADEKPMPGTAKNYIITPAPDKEQESDSYIGTIRLSPEERRRRTGARGLSCKLPLGEICSLVKNIEKWRNLRNVLGTK